MFKHILPAIALLVLTGCTSTESGSSMSMAPSTAAAPAAASDRAALVGSWSGNLSGGSPVSVSIPASGTPSYTFDGQRVPVRSARMSGDTLVLTVGTGGGTVALTPQGSQLNLQYSFRGDRSSGTLSRA